MKVSYVVFVFGQIQTSKITALTQNNFIRLMTFGKQSKQMGKFDC